MAKQKQDVSEIKKEKKPVAKKCKRCKGEGKLKNPMYKDGQTCPECGGEGTARYL